MEYIYTTAHVNPTVFQVVASLLNLTVELVSLQDVSTTNFPSFYHLGEDSRCRWIDATVFIQFSELWANR